MAGFMTIEDPLPVWLLPCTDLSGQHSALAIFAVHTRAISWSLKDVSREWVDM